MSGTDPEPGIWPQFIQGTAMGLLFVPLSTLSIVSISREKMGNATSLVSLMRNLGAGIGIAFVATSILRHAKARGAILAEHVNPYSPQSQLAFDRARDLFLSYGSDYTTATQQALAALAAMVQRQAAMIALLDIFRLLAVILLLGIPLVFIMKRPVGRAGPPPGVH